MPVEGHTDKRYPAMKKQPTIAKTLTAIATGPTGILTVLSVSPFEEDHGALQTIVRHSGWILLHARDLKSGLAMFQQHEIPIVLCERVLQPGTWINLLEHMNTLPHPPSLIVTSRLADDHLWSVALNLGAWDVLAKPFDRKEVVRSVKSGWEHWYDQIQMPATVVKVMTTAS